MSKRLMCGVGVMNRTLTRKDITEKTLRGRAYTLWRSMLYRCYYKVEKYNKSYVGCTVCERWKLFSNFEEDIQYLPRYDEWLEKPNMCLDKDILGKYHKRYAPQYCMFITKSENSKERIQRVINPIIQADVIAKRVAKYSKKINATKNGVTMQFSSVRECARKINGYGANIVNCLKGKKHSYKGYVFEYVG